MYMHLDLWCGNCIVRHENHTKWGVQLDSGYSVCDGCYHK
jgi:hypothetical protein